MINRSSVKVSSPPIVQNLIDDELTIQVAQKTLAVPGFSCHSQDVERMIKEMRRAFVIVFDKKSCRGVIVL